MTEYEAATLASRELGLWIAGGQLAVTFLIGLAQIAVVWFGIRIMQRSGTQRAREHDQRHEEAMKRQEAQHAEAMVALRALIERTAPPDQSVKP